MNIRFADITCYSCEELKEELSKLRSMIIAIEQLPAAFGIAGDFDDEHWVKKRDIISVIEDKEYK